MNLPTVPIVIEKVREGIGHVRAEVGCVLPSGGLPPEVLA